VPTEEELDEVGARLNVQVHLMSDLSEELNYVTHHDIVVANSTSV
jgi:hypothetical protein